MIPQGHLFASRLGVRAQLAIAAMAAMALAACGDDLVPPGEPGHFTVSGTIRYEDRPPLDTGALGPATPVPARGVQVAVIAEDDGAVLAMTVADDDGAYTVDFDANEGEPVHVLAATTSVVATRPIDVRNTSTENIHGFGGPTFAAASTTADVLVTVDSGEAQAFNIFDNLVDVMDRIPTLFPGRTQEPIEAFWSANSFDGTYYDNGALRLLGDPSDDDGFDDAVILHECGHWIEDVYGRSDSPGGDHDGSPTLPTLAWSEGFATYFAMAIRDVPIYSDSNAAGGFSYNGDTTNTKANPNLALDQKVSEDMVTEILWDMGDAPDPDDDTVEDTHDHVIGIEGYLHDAALRAVGSPGVDLVDALDGWFTDRGLGTCSGMRDLLDTRHTFPYDYGSGAGTCP